jgi:hypothetical protein
MHLNRISFRFGKALRSFLKKSLFCCNNKTKEDKKWGESFGFSSISFAPFEYQIPSKIT